MPPNNRVPLSSGYITDQNDTADVLTGIGAGAGIANKAFAGGADPAASDSTAAIAAALAAAPPGTVVTGPPGVYQVTSPLTVPAQVGFAAAAPWGNIFPPPAGLVLKPAAGFTGTAVLNMGSGSYAAGISIDGSAIAGTTKGIDGGTAVNAILDNVYIWKVPGIGLDVSRGARGWHVNRVKIDGVGAQGVACAGHSEGQFYDVHVIGSAGHCWSIAGAVPNTRFVCCRAEFAGAGKDGFHVTGTWNAGNGSGGVVFDGCSTDRNDNNGFSVAVTATVPIMLTGCMFRRDSRNAGGGGFAGITVSNTTAPVLIDNCSVFPGVDDGGAGTNSPASGLALTATNTLVAVSNSIFHAQTAGISGSSGASYRNVWTRTGSTSAPTAPVLQADTS